MVLVGNLISSRETDGGGGSGRFFTHQNDTTPQSSDWICGSTFGSLHVQLKTVQRGNSPLRRRPFLHTRDQLSIDTDSSLLLIALVIGQSSRGTSVHPWTFFTFPDQQNFHRLWSFENSSTCPYYCKVIIRSSYRIRPFKKLQSEHVVVHYVPQYCCQMPTQIRVLLRVLCRLSIDETSGTNELDELVQITHKNACVCVYVFNGMPTTDTTHCTLFDQIQ